MNTNCQGQASFGGEVVVTSPVWFSKKQLEGFRKAAWFCGLYVSSLFFMGVTSTSVRLMLGSL